MNQVDKQYFELVEHILYNGTNKSDRTGTGTKSIFDYTMRFNMKEGFPLLTSKRVYLKGVVHELLWFLGNHLNDEKYTKFGLTNIKYLVDNNVNIWVGDSYKKFKTSIDFLPEITEDRFIELIKTNDSFALKHGDLGKIYGHQWRKWRKYYDLNDVETDYVDIDQIKNLINDLKNNPDSRRLMVTAWNVADLPKMTLPPCHYGFQCYTRVLSFDERVKHWTDSLDKSFHYGDDMTEEKLDELQIPKRGISLKWTQRSVDTFLGLPFNIASYGLLLELLAQEVNMIPEDLIFSGGDCHIYLDHIESCKIQLYQETFYLPKIKIEKKSIFDIKYEDIKPINYKHSASIKGKLSN